MTAHEGQARVDSSLAVGMSDGVLDLPIAPIRFIYF